MVVAPIALGPGRARGLIAGLAAGASLVMVLNAGATEPLSDANAEAGPPLVGALGTTEAIDFEGNRSFFAPALRAGVAGWRGYLASAHPSAPLAAHLEALREALERGYRALGFPDVAVGVTLAPHGERLLARIDEGPRFRLREVRVQGARAVPAADVVGALTNRPAPVDPLVRAAEGVMAVRRARARQQEVERKLADLAAETGLPVVRMPEPEGLTADVLGPQPRDSHSSKPCVVAGEPAPFSALFRHGLRKVVQRMLAERGYPLAEVDVTLETDRAAGLANLVVHVQEGPAACIGEIRVVGNRRNTAEEIIRCAGLASGMPAYPETFSRARLALWNSARFWVFDVETATRGERPSTVDVTITVDEIEELPLLREPLPRQLAAVVRLANWLTVEAPRRGFRITAVGADGVGAEVAISEQHAAGVVEDGGGTSFGFTAAPAGSRILAANDRTAVEFGAGLPEGMASVQVRLTTTAGQEQRNLILAGVGWSATEKDVATEPRIVDAEFTVAPSYAASMFLKVPRDAWAFEDGDVILRRRRPALEIRFREDTGELITAKFVNDPAWGQAPWLERMELRVGGAATDRITPAIEAMRGRLPRPDQPPGSFAQVLLSSAPLQKSLASASPLLGGRPGSARFVAAARAAEKLVTALFRAMALPADASGDEAFQVPPDPESLEQPAAFAQAIGAGLYGWLTRIWPADAWATRLAREYYYILSGQTTYTERVLDEIHADARMGPLGSLMAAKLLGGRAPAHAWRFARRAVDHASVAEFHEDWRFLLGPDTWLRRGVEDFLGSLADLSDDEVAALTAGLSASEAALIRDGIADVRRRDGRPVLDVLGPYVDRWWELHVQSGFESSVARMLDGGDSVDGALVAATVCGLPLSRRLVNVRRAVPALFPWAPATSASASPEPLLAPEEEQLVTLALVDRDFQMRGGFVKDEYLDQLVDQYVSERFGGDWRSFGAALAVDGLVAADLREVFRLREVLAFMMSEIAGEVAPPSAEEIALAAASAAGAAGGTARLRLVSVARTDRDGRDQRALAESIRAEAVREGSFDAVWNRCGQRDPAGPRCDDVEEIGRGKLRRELDEAAFALEPGGFSAVLESGAAYVVVQIVARDPHGVSEDLRRSVAEEIRTRREREAIEVYLQRLRREAVVRVLVDPATSATNASASAGGTRFEFENLKVAATSEAAVRAEPVALEGRRWSAEAHARCEGGQGSWVEWEFDVGSDGDYDVDLFATRAIDHGEVQVWVDGASLGAPIELAAPTTQPSGVRHLGTRHLSKGTHLLRSVATGKHSWSTGYNFGLDAFELVPVGSAP